MSEQIFRNMTVGRVPVIKGKVDATVQYAARAALGTEGGVHVAVSVSENYAYYLAVASSALSSTPDFASPLAAALPTHPQHKGAGVYVQYEHGAAFAIICSDGRFDPLYGTSEAVESEIAAEGLPIHDVSDLSPWTLVSPQGKRETAGDLFGVMLSKVALVWFGVASAALLAASGAGLFIKNTSQVEITQAYQAAVKALSVEQPLAADLARFEAISGVAIRSGGWIEKYKITSDGQHTFTLVMPQWVSKDYVQALGEGVVTELDAKQGMVIATKAAVAPAAKSPNVEKK